MFNKIIFDKSFPELVRPIVENVLVSVCWLLPMWIQRVRGGWNLEDGVIATMRTEKDYRYCRLTVHPEFLQHSADYQEQLLYHELFHTFNTPVSDYAAEVIEMLCDRLENDLLKDVCIKELKRKMEAATEDFAYVLANKFKDER